MQIGLLNESAAYGTKHLASLQLSSHSQLGHNPSRPWKRTCSINLVQSSVFALNFSHWLEVFKTEFRNIICPTTVPRFEHLISNAILHNNAWSTIRFRHIYVRLVNFIYTSGFISFLIVLNLPFSLLLLSNTGWN